jgi:hypothetical protein
MLEASNPNAIRYSQLAYSGFIATYQTSPVTEQTVEGQTVRTACFRPLTATRNPQGALSDRRLAPEDCAYKVPASAGGQVRYGHHPDNRMFILGDRDDRDGEWAGILLLDSARAGVWDTVIVDLNFNHDFTDDKPATRESPLSFRDVDGDGVADLSGGLLYYIADGTLAPPGTYLWEDPEAPWPVPEAGAMVALLYATGTHGTLCGSNVASQGRLGVPPNTYVRWRNQEKDPALDANGQPFAVNPGMAPEARLISVGNVYDQGRLLFASSWRYVVFGTLRDRSDDDVQVVSNSYGFSDVHNDFWDAESRYVDHYVRRYSPTTTFMKAAGNGGPGYGTFTSPMPEVALGVAASTQYSTLGWDSAYETSQITYGDIQQWSCRGPASNGGNGVAVSSDGAFDAGGIPINAVTLNANLAEERRDGRFANAVFGGTSQATPMAGGNLALVYQAFRAAHDRWPTWAEARALLMGGARFNGYDPLVAGAGTVDAANSVRLAAGLHGVYAEPPSWVAGDYRGERYPAFAKLSAPGTTNRQTVRLSNPGQADVEVTLKAQTLRRTGSYSIDFTTQAVAEESVPFAAQSPDYLVPIDKTKIPEGTDLMIVRGVMPLRELDPDGNYQWTTASDSLWYSYVYQHTDWNDDGKLWADANGDGIVQHSLASPIRWEALDASRPGLDFAASEIQEGEYSRVNYATNGTNNWSLAVHHPRERWGSGLYIGLQHAQSNCDYNTGRCTGGRSPSVPNTHFTLRVDFYRYEDWPWLSASRSTLTVPGRSGADVELSLAVPADAPAGHYQGMLFADYARAAGDEPVPAGGGFELSQQRLSIPVSANVATVYDWQGSRTFGGPAADDRDAPYNNGAVRGAFFWGWRNESGDWRFFFADAPSRPAEGTFWLLRTVWQDAMAGQSDIDTRFYRQVDDPYSNPDHPDNQDGESVADPAWYGPGGMEPLATSGNAYRGSGVYGFLTTSGANEDWLAAPAEAGLHEVMLHNNLFSGSQIEMPFETTLSSLWVSPAQPVVYADACTTVRLRSQLPLDGFSAAAVGFSVPITTTGIAIGQDTANDPTTAGYKRTIDLPSEAARFTVTMRAQTGNDLDVHVLRDANLDGTFDLATERIAQNTGTGVNKTVALAPWQAAGPYAVWVHGASVPSGQTSFDLTLDIVAGDGLRLRDAPDRIEADREVSLRLCPDLGQVPNLTEAVRGALGFGPAGARRLFTLPVRWSPQAPAMPKVLLPLLLKNSDLGGGSDALGGPTR